MNVIEHRDKNIIVLFGICDSLNQLIWDMNREAILAITDLRDTLYHKQFKYKSAKEIVFDGFISSINEVCSMNFDYIVMTDYSILNQAYEVLKSKGIPDERIVMYEYYVQCIRAHTFYSVQEEFKILSLIQSLNFHKIIDMDLFFTDKYRFSREYAEMTFSPNLQVDAYSPVDIKPIYNNIYRKIYKNIKDFAVRPYDAAFFSDYRSFQGYLSAFDSTKDIADNIILRFRPNSIAYHEFCRCDFSTWGNIRNINLESSWITVLSKHRNDEMKIYIVTHKPCRTFAGGGWYQLIQAGKKVNPPIQCPGDDTGDSISELNPFINELTALYWIWKNTSHEYVGLVHYRRYFLSTPLVKGMKQVPILSEEQARSFLDDYDIILRYKLYERSDSIKRNMVLSFGADLLKKSYETIRKFMLARQPDYVSSFDYVLGGTGIFVCNMFVCKKKIIDAYCDWLFSFFIDAVKDFDTTGLEGNNRRIMGYWGEILLTVWIVNQDLNIKQLPWWMPPENLI